MNELTTLKPPFFAFLGKVCNSQNEEIADCNFDFLPSGVADSNAKLIAECMNRTIEQEADKL